MKAVMRIVLLLLGLGVGEGCAEEPFQEEDRSSPIFVVRTPAEPAARAVAPAPQTRVAHQLAELIRRDAGAVVVTATPAADPVVPVGETLQLEKMTVEVKKVLELPGRETPVQKFIRTGYIWEFSPTKRFMLGPRGDKIGLMFSFDW